MAGPAARGSNTPSAPAPINLANVAGTWTVQTLGEGSDSVLTTYTLVATGTTVAHYATTGADSVVRLRNAGTKNP